MIFQENEIMHKCPTESGSSGAPIINLEKLKVIGIHCGSKGKLNYGIVLKEPIKEYFKIKIEKKNEIIIKVRINKEDLGKEIYFLDNDLYTDD